MKKTLSLFLALCFLFSLSVPVFAAHDSDSLYIVIYTKPSYKGTPYEKLFKDHREFLNPENYNISGIENISILGAFRSDNPHIDPPYYVLLIELSDTSKLEAHLKAPGLVLSGIANSADVMTAVGLQEFRENFVPWGSFPENHFALYRKGDIMCVNEVTAYSARTVLRVSVGLEKKEDLPWLLGDMNLDGKLTAEDARAILRLSVGLEE